MDNNSFEPLLARVAIILATGKGVGNIINREEFVSHNPFLETQFNSLEFRTGDQLNFEGQKFKIVQINFSVPNSPDRKQASHQAFEDLAMGRNEANCEVQVFVEYID